MVNLHPATVTTERRETLFQPTALGVWIAALVGAWIIAWWIDVRARDAFGWGINADTVYWVAMKIALWVLPPVIVLMQRRWNVAGYVGFTDPAHGIRIGVLAGLAVLALSFTMEALLGGAAFNIPILDASLFNAVLVAPLVEEFAIRGFFLESLERAGLKFTQANSYAGIAFVLLHVPGWYFQGRLRSPLSMVQTAIFLWLLALLLGWIKKNSGSLYASVAVHVLNNLYASARG